MPFIKLDCGMLNSTVWSDSPLRNVFITALLMADPREFPEPVKQISVDSLSHTGWAAPPGWYGFVPSASTGIIQRAIVDSDTGMESLRKLGEPDILSRSQDFEGRRMIRVEGGFVILNYMKFRDHDYSAADRMRKMRARRKALRNSVTVHPNVTQAEDRGQIAEAETERSKPPTHRESKTNTENSSNGKASGGPAALPSDGIDKHMAAQKVMEDAGLNDRFLNSVVATAIESYCRHVPDSIPSGAAEEISKLWSEYSAADIRPKSSARTWFGDSKNFLEPDTKWRKKPKAEKPVALKPQNGTPYKTPAWAFERKV